MKKLFTHKRVLVLGGPGLVGRNVIESLLSGGVRNITAVGLPKETAWQELRKVEKMYHARIRKCSANLLVPPKFQRQTLTQVLTTPSKRQALTKLLTKNLTHDAVVQQPIAKVVKAVRPHLIIDCINIATQCAYIDQSPDHIQNAGTGSLLLLRYYQILFHLLGYDFWKGSGRTFHVEQYLKVGTTGIGGMGLDIPFTHGEERPSISLLKKVAMAGAQTNILLAMRNSRDIARVQEIVPATAIFQLAGFDPRASAKHRDSHLEIDGGESRGYALEEFRLLTHQSQMGVIDAQELAHLIVGALKNSNSRHDVLSALGRSGVRRSAGSFGQRQRILSIWNRTQNQRLVPDIAHGNLGPWRTRKLLFELSILLDQLYSHREGFARMTPAKLGMELLATIRKSPGLRAEIRYAKLRVSTAQAPKNPNVADHIIDLSQTNLGRWKKTLQSLNLNRQKKPLYAGDVLALLVDQRHDLRAIP